MLSDNFSREARNSAEKYLPYILFGVRLGQGKTPDWTNHFCHHIVTCSQAESSINIGIPENRVVCRVFGIGRHPMSHQRSTRAPGISASAGFPVFIRVPFLIIAVFNPAVSQASASSRYGYEPRGSSRGIILAAPQAGDVLALRSAGDRRLQTAWVIVPKLGGAVGRSARSRQKNLLRYGRGFGASVSKSFVQPGRRPRVMTA